MWRRLTGSLASITPMLAFAFFASATPLGVVSSQAYAQSQPSASNPASSYTDPAAPPTNGPNTPKPIVAKQSPEEVATKLLHEALHQAVWGPPVACTVRQRIEAFGQQVNGSGHFARAGEGSGKLKLLLKLPAGDSLNTLLQVSDGQKLHTIESLGGQKKHTFIDLVQVRKSLPRNNQTYYDRTIAMYLAIGGQAESLRKLCQQYEWHSVRSSQYAGQPVWLLTGRLATVPPAVRAFAGTDEQLFAGGNATGLLPQTARVAIRKADDTSGLSYWLYQVDQRSTSDDTVAESPHRKSDLRLITEWLEPSVLEDRSVLDRQIDADVLNAGSTNAPLYEETESYLPPLNIALLPPLSTAPINDWPPNGHPQSWEPGSSVPLESPQVDGPHENPPLDSLIR